MLVLFFAFTAFVEMESFVVYAAIYALYFFPWRLLRGERVPREMAASP